MCIRRKKLAVIALEKAVCTQYTYHASTSITEPTYPVFCFLLFILHSTKIIVTIIIPNAAENPHTLPAITTVNVE